MIGVFRRLGYPNEKLGVVVNRYQSEDVVSPAEAAEVRSYGNCVIHFPSSIHPDLPLCA
jgi:hypothetical protein